MPGFGVEGSVGGYVNSTNGRDQVGGFISTGTGPGLNISADAFVGYVPGPASNLNGDSDNLNLGVGPISVTVMFHPVNGRLFSGGASGFTVGIGPSIPFIVASVTKSTTAAGKLGASGQRTCTAPAPSH